MFDIRRSVLIVVLLVIGTIGFLAFLRPGKPPPVEVPREQLDLRDAKWFRIGETNPFTGVLIDNYPSGERKTRSEILNGRLNGVSETWCTNGQRLVLEHFRAGVSHGLRTKWHPNGQKLSEVQIVDGNLEGMFRRWDQDGALYEEIQMANGKAEGVSRAYYPSGFVRTEARLKAGEVLDQKFWKDGEQKAEPLLEARRE